MRQVNVSLPDDLRAKLDAASAAAGHTLGTEIRNRLERSFDWGRFNIPTQMLLQLIGNLALFSKAQTGRDWRDDAAANFVFRRAVAILLARLKPEGEPVLNPAELPPNRPVHCDDLEGMAALEAMAAGLEAIIAHGRTLTGDEQRDLSTKYRPSLDNLGPATAALFRDMGWKDPKAPSEETPPPAPRSRLRKPKQEGPK
jgi:hypothetical protein